VLTTKAYPEANKEAILKDTIQPRKNIRKKDQDEEGDKMARKKKKFRKRYNRGQLRFIRAASAWRFPSTKMGKTYKQHMKNMLRYGDP
jgi:hypothetical protein